MPSGNAATVPCIGGACVEMRMMLCYQIYKSCPQICPKFVYECDLVDALTQAADDFGKYWQQIPELKAYYTTNGVKNLLKIHQ